MGNYKILFSDIGGVLLSNGWGHESRAMAAKKYKLDYEEMDALHHFIFNVFEIGKVSLDDYLDTVVFNHPRNFFREDFKDFMFAQSVLLPQMLPWLIEWKKTHTQLKIISINNEARELNNYRIKTFKLHDFFDAFVSSCEVGMRKPDPGIFKLALGIAQAEPHECLYFDDRIMLVEAARKEGIHAYHHESFEATRQIIEEAVNP
ncbi:MAG: HAD-IA family hydrolase [Bacteroidota bacterium]|nr:HAD-IA family hydrolase [Bacteroidota bacterium]